jgi:hypothetical protein
LTVGSFATLQCIVGTGDLPLVIQWEYPGIHEPNSGISTMLAGDRVSLLTIPVVASKHFGNFTCIASNSAGHDMYTTLLMINGLRKQVYIFV